MHLVSRKVGADPEFWLLDHQVELVEPYLGAPVNVLLECLALYMCLLGDTRW